MHDRLYDLPLILVSGQARSGTTILTRAIGAHPQVLSNNRENVWLRDLMAVIVQTLEDPSRVRQLSVSSEVFLHSFRETAFRMLFPNDLVEGANHVRALSTFSSLRDDMFETLPQFLPNFQLLNIVRNGVEVVSSRLKHAHISKAGDFRTHCVAWAHAIDIVRWFGQRPELKKRFFLVRHEQLLEPNSCRDVFARIQHRFGLDRSDACEKFVFENFVSQNSSSKSDSPQTVDALRTRGEAWKAWSGNQRCEFEAICGDAMSELGYEIPWSV
jgi:hypothetical protein